MYKKLIIKVLHRKTTAGKEGREQTRNVHNRAHGEEMFRTNYRYFFGDNTFPPSILRIRNQKPILKSGPKFDFNLAYTGGTVVCAASTAFNIGIDVEAYREIDVFSLKPRFSANEWRIIESADLPSKCAIDFWVRKEAVLKACGLGLSIAPETIDTTQLVATVKKAVYRLQQIDLCTDTCCWIAYRRMPGLVNKGEVTNVIITRV